MPTAVATLGVVPVSTSVATGPLADWRRGLTLHPVQDGYYGSKLFEEAINGVAKTGANSVALTIPLVQTDLWSTDVRTSSITPTDSELSQAIRYIHSKKMSVMLIPHLRTVKNDWAAYVDPEDRDAWFKSYGDALKHIAGIADAEGVEVLCVGSEMTLMTSGRYHPTNTKNWTDLIHQVRGIFGGKLTFSAHWGPSPSEKDRIEFWPLLDFIGLAAYFYLPTETDSVEALMGAWDVWARREITPLQKRYNKPVVFTEVGYRNVPDARKAPWSWEPKEGNDEQEQANLYEALFSYWSKVSYFQGVYIWEWLPAIPDGNTYFTPSGKLAEDVLTDWFTGKTEPSTTAEKPGGP
jgi:hypothetical protein